MRVILLGPQRRPTVDAVVRSLGFSGLAGPFATVTAGWQEREADDGELVARLGGRAVNLSLYRRWLDVQESDPEYAAGERAMQEVLAELQDIYLVRLDYALQAVYALQRHSGQDWLLSDAVASAIAAVRELDSAHLERVNEVRGEFFARLPPHERPSIAGHRAAVAGVLAEAAGLVVAGGDVSVLAEVLHLFNVAAALRGDLAGWPVIAWSAGAMGLTDRIVLFHDRAPQGPGHPEVYASGLSVLRDVVLLPHARARLLLDDTVRMAVFARRFAPARCILLEAGTRVEAGEGGGYPPGTRALGEDGHVTVLEAA
ncbi:MAG TPA: Type 1 glutamine amidotransferase-like domain-containing protein [Streptosporangiaceae bacterium]|nr:Type 1 glutamine amidotransferase-like domain-containing protein [Streptosporangiaceae bacterium]